MSYFERLARRSKEIDSLVCVGLDPHFGRMPVEALASHNRWVIEQTAPYAACYKPNFAFYEQYGVPGLRVLEETLAAVPPGVPVIGDIKRGDIGSTAEAYARAAFDAWGFDAVTLSPYLGLESIRPFLDYPGRGIYVVCRTSVNEGAADLQGSVLGDGLFVYEEVARLSTIWAGGLGLVVGATAPEEIGRVRQVAPKASLLIPGVGAQGGDVAAVIAAAGSEPGTLVISSSRAIYYADDPGAAARALRDELNLAARGA